MLSPLDEMLKMSAKPVSVPTPTKEYKPISSLESMVDKIGQKVYERQSLKKMGCAIRWKRDKTEKSHQPKAQQPSHPSENSALLNSFLVQQILNKTVLLARDNYIEFFFKKPPLKETTAAATAPPTPPELKLMISGTTAPEEFNQSETTLQLPKEVKDIEMKDIVKKLLKPKYNSNSYQEFRRDFSIARILDDVDISTPVVSSESDDYENQVKDTGPIKSKTLIRKIGNNPAENEISYDVQDHVESTSTAPTYSAKTAKMKKELFMDNEGSDIDNMKNIQLDCFVAEMNWRPLRKTAARQQRDSLLFFSSAPKRLKLSQNIKKEKKDGITKYCVPSSLKKHKKPTTPATEKNKCCKELKKEVTDAVEDCQCSLGKENCIRDTLFPNEEILNWLQCERTNCGKWFHVCCVFGYNEEYIERKRKFYCCSRWGHANAKKAKAGIFSKQLCNK
ncbi:hypothetical protein L3Y34_013714 [Caenorhabditis briggsae]|uniref:Zinc finger PHD-type domain-containing protein n=1 Tax=Caenorhabditis briggsae TaxID=6238 RepID=A0AAE8ZXK2_CAEBR|nr:hypothetical protein L3Y34_013714 [Caenorhabditis briggsae]